MNNKELVELLNSLKILQTSDWEESIPEKIWDEYFVDSKTVVSGLDVDKYRWHELSTEVLRINDGFIGVRSITTMYSEQSSYGDIFHHLEFFEMEEIPSFTYKKKV